MVSPFSILPGIPLKQRTTFGPETKPLELVDLGSPAIMVMTDFTAVTPVTIFPEASIESALKRMKTAGVRLIFVVNDAYEIIGLITAKDILGERPVTITQQTGTPHSAITVEMVMTPQRDIQVLDASRVRQASVGDIVETLRVLERQHALVARIDKTTGKQQVIGMFSTSQIGRLLDRDVMTGPPLAHSFAEIVEKVG